MCFAFDPGAGGCNAPGGGVSRPGRPGRAGVARSGHRGTAKNLKNIGLSTGYVDIY
jgi:hypothetical protein